MTDHPVGDACPATPPPDPEYVGPITPADLRHGASVLAERGYMIAAARLRDFADKVEQGDVVIRPKPG